MKNRSEKKRLDGNSFLLAVTIILFFVMYIVGIIMFGGRGFATVSYTHLTLPTNSRV